MTSSSPIVGHEDVRRALLGDLETGNVAHAYLFAGDRHLGKYTVAQWFAGLLLSHDASTPEEAARLRESAERLLHPDLLALDQLWMEDRQEDMASISHTTNIAQDHRRKAHAKTDTIGIDDVRALQERLHDVRLGTYRCCLIRSAERLQEEAVNALLKILEEPPSGVVFFLTTQALASLAPTLISRMRVVRFAPLSSRELLPLLQDLSDDDKRFLRHVAQGAPGIICRLREDPDALTAERKVHTQAVAFWRSASPVERLKLLSPLAERSDDASRLLLHLALALHEQPSKALPHQSAALHDLARDLTTNAGRPLLLQRFVLTMS